MEPVTTDDLTRAELSVIGSAILTSGQILDELDFNPTDFRAPDYEHVYRTIDAMRRAGKPIDAITVTAEITVKDPLLITKAIEATPSAASASHYAGIVTDAASRRRLALAGRTITEMADRPGDAEAIVEEARKLLDNSIKTTKTEPVRFVWETIEQTIDNLDAGDVFVPTPWDNLNNIIGGLRPGAVYTIGARPGVGKSVVGVQLALELAKQGGVAMLSLEMSQDDVNKRIVASEKQISMSKLMNPSDLTPNDWQQIAEWTSSYRNPLAVSKSSSVDIIGIKRFARNVHRRAPLAGVVVDYLQLMSQAPQDRRARHEFVADMSRQLKLLAMDMNVPVVMLSQLNRQSESRDDKMPRIADLRESGAVEQDSDVVILLHRDINNLATKHELKMLVAKNRHGNTGVCDFDFRGHWSRLDAR